MEHKLITGGEQWLPFARSRIRALRATGLQYACQKYEIDGARVEVRISGGHEFIRLDGSGYLVGQHTLRTSPTTLTSRRVVLDPYVKNKRVVSSPTEYDPSWDSDYPHGANTYRDPVIVYAGGGMSVEVVTFTRVQPVPPPWGSVYDGTANASVYSCELVTVLSPKVQVPSLTYSTSMTDKDVSFVDVAYATVLPSVYTPTSQVAVASGWDAGRGAYRYGLWCASTILFESTLFNQMYFTGDTHAKQMTQTLGDDPSHLQLVSGITPAPTLVTNTLRLYTRLCCIGNGKLVAIGQEQTLDTATGAVTASNFYLRLSTDHGDTWSTSTPASMVGLDFTTNYEARFIYVGNDKSIYFTNDETRAAYLVTGGTLFEALPSWPIHAGNPWAIVCTDKVTLLGFGPGCMMIPVYNRTTTKYHVMFTTDYGATWSFSVEVPVYVSGNWHMSAGSGNATILKPLVKDLTSGAVTQHAQLLFAGTDPHPPGYGSSWADTWKVKFFVADETFSVFNEKGGFTETTALANVGEPNWLDYTNTKYVHPGFPGEFDKPRA